MSITCGIKLPAALTSADGFTLIEQLVAMVAGIVVLGALFALFTFSLNQTQRLSDKVQADQQGRTAMTHIVEELHSTCTGLSEAGILAGSTSTKLRFISTYGVATSGAAVPGEAIKHEITFEGGKLVDHTYPSKGAEPEDWTFPTASPAGGELLAEHITQATETTESGTTTTPVFQYYEYNEATGQLYSTAMQGTSLTAREAGSEVSKAAKVLITFTANPTDGDTETGRSVNLSDSVTLRVTPTSTGSEANTTTCE